jgi:phosphatidylethanolamine/phosphatidyl-N-methylethanolamine N-methyltransferase
MLTDLHSRKHDSLALVQRRYDRIAPVYDVFETFMEYGVQHWRRGLWQRVHGARVLEVGVGTGKNLPLHPVGKNVTAIDLSPRMLERARRKARRLRPGADFLIADVQSLPYPDNTFDAAVATFVFCSVPDPVRGLREIRRVLKPGGQFLLLEHVLSERWGLRPLMKVLDFIPAHI